MKSVLFLALSLVTLNAFADQAPVSSVVIKDRTLLADMNGMTVYTFSPDGKDKSNCYGACAKAWPPIMVENNAQFDAPYGVVSRKDGTHQLSIDGKPLYLYADDKKSGDAKGDNEFFVWHVVVLKK